MFELRLQEPFRQSAMMVSKHLLTDRMTDLGESSLLAEPYFFFSVEMRQALSNLDATKDDSLRHSRPLDDILLNLALDEDRNVLSSRQQERVKENMSTATSTLSQDQQPGTPMDYSSGEDDEDINAQTVDQVKLSELPLSSPDLAEGTIDFAKDTLADSQESFVELKPTLDDVDDDEEEEEFIYRPSTPVESSDTSNSKDS
jgi:hypothetical protein